ncbi:DUF4352 domain-containing protein [Actinomadura sp. DC4]|uniref:DUF4352 domain-containing protein n=1 Tax=Actinomadura sp. DC4 TaxID=3055069 RepID=UPI0025B17118|nr:DUF4352 domain-containing protein [Actinomadura sp. DC4]MDN3355053.1 DUF4352 domain-containing protein [Actinomadura sp. DC4]
MATQYQPPAYQPAPRRRRTGLIIFLVILGLFVLLFAGCAALFVSGAKEVGKNPEVNAPKKAYAMNQPAGDGRFTFVVTKMRRTGHVGDSSITRTDAQGEFVVLTVTVTNHGKTAQLLDASNQKLLAGGKTYDADTNVFADSKAFLNNINPGNSVTASIAFDVPKGTRPTQVVLHDSAFSNGVRVALA